MLTRAQATEKVLVAKHAKGLTFEALIGFQGRGLDDVVQPDFCHGRFLKVLIFQWS